MINKSTVINLAFLKLGEQNQLYNINITDRMAIAETLFNTIIKSIASDAQFAFNARTIKLNLNLEQKNSRDEFRYNKPTDYLNRIWISDREARIENEFIYSKVEDVEMCYCYQMDLADYPDYIEDYLVITLAERLAEAYDVYYSKIPAIQNQRSDIINKLLVSEGLPFAIPR